MLRILYLEDSPFDVLLVRRALIEAGLLAEIHAVDTPADYAAAVDTQQFDLILSDAGLPGFSGLEALALARQRCPAVPFIFFSGATDPNRIKASLDLGPLSESATAQITQTGPGRINIKVVDASGITSAILGGLNFNVNIPKLPAGVSIKSISVTQQGLRVTAVGHNTTLSK